MAKRLQNKRRLPSRIPRVRAAVPADPRNVELLREAILTAQAHALEFSDGLDGVEGQVAEMIGDLLSLALRAMGRVEGWGPGPGEDGGDISG